MSVLNSVNLAPLWITWIWCDCVIEPSWVRNYFSCVLRGSKFFNAIFIANITDVQMFLNYIIHAFYESKLEKI